MKCLAVVILLVAVVQSQKPHRCGCPKEWEGRMLKIINGGDMKIHGWIGYDAKNERIRFAVTIHELRHRHKTKFVELIFLYKEKRMYIIENKNESCKVKHFDQPFQDVFRIPSSAIFLTEEYVGSSGVSEAGVLLHTFTGQTDSGKYLITVTAKRCLPVMNLFHIKLGTVFMSFYDIVLGIAKPEKFVPPDICDGKEPDGFTKPVFSFSAL